MALEDSEAERLLIAGISHALSATALGKLGGENAFNGQYSASMFLLMGFALELTLKAEYLRRGGQGAKTDIGHDLQKAYDSARTLGFEDTVPGLRDLIGQLRDSHFTNHFRYLPEAPSITLPDHRRALEIMNETVTASCLSFWPRPPC